MNTTGSPQTKPNNAPFNFKLGTIVLGFALIVSGTILLAIHKSGQNNASPYSPQIDIAKCEINILKSLKAGANSLLDYDHISNHCIGELSNIYKLQDYATRRDAFDIQYAQSNFILWLVICITISGIVLAAIQLVSAYNLSLYFDKHIEDNTSLKVDAKSISIGSTVSGLIILAMSFAFFLVYVTQVYPIEITDKVSIPTSTSEPQTFAPAPVTTGPDRSTPKFANNMGFMPFDFKPAISTASTGGYVAPRPTGRDSRKLVIASFRAAIPTTHGSSNIGIMPTNLQGSGPPDRPPACPSKTKSSSVD